MRYLLTMVFLLQFGVNLHASKTFIYIDNSNIRDIDKVIKQTEDIIRASNYDNFIVYISNDKSPIILNSLESLSQDLKQLYSISPSSPQVLFEVNMISETLETYFPDIQSRNYDSTLSEEINMYFIFDLTHSIEYDQTKTLINKVLLSNRLKFEPGLVKGLNVTAYYNDNFKQEEKSIISNIYKKQGYEIIFF
ncbi:MAG: hypothetical protein COA49_03340 [Bacteroidetes bacterium]|nr:MAG: hypothetical protein COA49_03340 [Bacteroidota bacterium]